MNNRNPKKFQRTEILKDRIEKLKFPTTEFPVKDILINISNLKIKTIQMFKN